MDVAQRNREMAALRNDNANLRTLVELLVLRLAPWRCDNGDWSVSTGGSQLLRQAFGVLGWADPYILDNELHLTGLSDARSAADDALEYWDYAAPVDRP